MERDGLGRQNGDGLDAEKISRYVCSGNSSFYSRLFKFDTFI